jgi:2-polyprenyl-6-methoxyphenol hydroxylase-like FAD-dependent oxidoreductase
MSEGGLHVVFGAGQVGLALASRLAGQGVSAWRAGWAGPGPLEHPGGQDRSRVLTPVTAR